MKVTTNKMGVSARKQVPLLLVLLAAVCIQSATCEQQTTATGGFKDNNDEQYVLGINRGDGSIVSPVRANNRILAVPLSLARFVFPNARAGDRQMQAAAAMMSAANNKRSSIDSLTGMSGIGKRSVPLEYINLEPIFRGQNGMRGPSLVHNMRWAPMSSIDSPAMVGDD